MINPLRHKSYAEKMVLDIDRLRMRYGTNDVLHDVTFQARHGEVLALLGPNGAGKTTTIEILEGFRMRSAGRVEVLSIDPAHGTERWRARVGVVLQSWRDHGKWRVHELLAHLGSYYACYSTDRIKRPWDAVELVAAVGLTEHANKKIKMLSGGQRRRLDVAIGIVGRPELLFLDEPTTGFDPQARHEFHDLVRSLANDHETTVPAYDARSGRGRKARRPHHHPERRADYRGWSGGGTVAPDRGPGPGALDPRRAAPHTVDQRVDEVRARLVQAVRRSDQ
jgi:ABC-type Mn2+/Zn2+ transport system ATPase subunit